MNKSASREPQPIWPEAPRYWPTRPFPLYRYMHGLNPHPTEDPLGHSYESSHESVDRAFPIDATNPNYLFGVDLYNQGYLWEAHESWELVWQAATGQQREFVHGLILNAAALLKWHEGRVRGAVTHSQKAAACLERVVHAGHSAFWGLDVPKFLKQMRAFYVPLWNGKPLPAGIPPQLELELQEPPSA
jgi:hypothetical protein